VSFCLFISNSNKQTPSPISILEATPKLGLVPSVDQTIASGVVDQIAGGLVVIFSHSLTESKDLVRGLLAITLSMAFQAFISVKLKQINTQISSVRIHQS
jgi:predicted membrane-bound spermidine synthase